MTAPVSQTPDLLAVVHDPPLVNPAPQGLFAATLWHEENPPLRWLANGVRFRPRNYGGESSFGLWGAAWCGDPGDNIKDGVRPDEDDPFDPLTAWAYDQCDLTSTSRDEVRDRVQQNLRLVEQVSFEREFAARLLIDAPSGPTTPDIVAAVAHLEAQLAKTNTVGLLHASAGAAALLQSKGLIVRTGGGLKSPLGHSWVFGGGYVEGLGSTIVATSPVEGWRSDIEVRTAIEARYNQFVAVAERHVVIGYEKAVARATVGEPDPAPEEE